MTGTDVVRSELSPKMEKAAILEASGISRADAAKAVGVSPKTLTAWGKRDDYRAEVTRAAGSQLALLENSVALLQQTAVDAAHEAIEKLREAMDAKDEYDRPFHKIRLDAAVALLTSPAVRALVDPKGGGGGGSAVAAAAVTIVRITREEDGSETVEFEAIEDGEVSSVEPGQGAED